METEEAAPLPSESALPGNGHIDQEEWREWQEWRQWRQWKESTQTLRKSTGDSSKTTETYKSSSVPGSESGIIQGGGHTQGQKPRGKDETHYILAGQPTGWAALDKAIREFDEEKVRDCKEDIDTLLVFAGLFSAVLTAFLVESYSLLLEDTAGESLTTLRQIAAQTSSYQSLGNSINSTVAAATYPSAPFQPSPVNIRINVLWFASLLFSLISASFGILVKQWLREYLAVQNPSPQARLRVRHLRYPELAKWQIFEIAAFLPLLLQLSLALFFIGLCYFTASVHSSIGHTALPLVAGWAFCFITVTLLPLFYPRCPYRTTLLKIVFILFHRLVGRLASQTARWAKDRVLGSREGNGYLSKVMVWLYGNIHLKFFHMSREYDECDEANVVRIHKKDLDILADADAIQSNDELLGTTIAEAANQVSIHSNTLDNLPTFVLRILVNRLAMSAHLDWMHALVVDLRTTDITLRARNAVLDMIEHYYWRISPENMALFTSWQGSLRSTFVLGLMLSLSGRDVAQIPHLTSLLSSRPMADHLPEFCREIVRRVHRSASSISSSGMVRPYARTIIRLLEGITGLQDVIDTWVKPTWILDAILHQYKSGSTESSIEFICGDDLLSDIPRNVAAWPWQTMPEELNIAVPEFLQKHLAHLYYLIDDPDTQSLARPGTHILAGHEAVVDTSVTEMLVTLFCTARYHRQLWSRASWRLTCWKMLTATPGSAATLATAVNNTPSADILCALSQVIPTSMRHQFRSQIGGTFGIESQQDMPSYWKSVLARTPVLPNPIRSGCILRLCCFSVYSLILIHGHQSPSLSRDAWMEIFIILSDIIERIDVASLDTSDDPAKFKIKKLATACLEVIRHEEVNARSWEEWPWTAKKGVLVFRAHSEGSLDKIRRMVAEWRSPPMHSVFPERLVVALERLAEHSWWQPVSIEGGGAENTDMRCICHNLLCPRIKQLKDELLML